MQPATSLYETVRAALRMCLTVTRLSTSTPSVDDSMT